MTKHQETREGIGRGAGICAMVGIGKGKGMNSGNALLLDASKDTWTRPDDGTGESTDLDTNANFVSATDCHSGKGAGREIGGKGTGWDSRCFGEAGQQNSQQSLIKRRQQFHRSETLKAKTTTTKLTTHDNGNIVKFNQGNDDNSEELHQLPIPEKFSALEVKEARTTLYSLVQQHHLAEFQLIKIGKRIPRNSNLLSLSPFFDNESNVIRVGGRLAKSPYDINKKFLVLIPRKSLYNKLLIREAHEKSFHSGPQMTLYTLRQTVWIPGGFALAKQAIHKCKPCIRQDARLLQPEMGDLPLERVVKSFTFSNTGINYCGPFYIKDSSSQESKVYVASFIFICFATRAVHMKTVNSLIKDDCLDAVKRFCARR